MPRLESLLQNSDDWRDLRRGGLGSSDAPVVMGDSHWMMPRTLWEIKTKRSEEPERDNPATRWGRRLEAPARAAYEKETAEIMEPHCMSHDRLSWMRASLDGLNFDGSLVLEVKCPQSRRDHGLALEGRVPRHYYAQLQHQLEVSHARELHYWSFDGRRGALVRVMPDQGYIDRLVQAEVEFWRNVTENRWPEPRFKEQDLSSDPNWSDAARRYRQVRERLDELSDQERELRNRLLGLSDSRRAVGAGVELIRTSRKGAVNYGAIPELEGVDLDRYRKEPVEVVKINLIEPNRQ
jgi:putative phage-type endonuclease